MRRSLADHERARKAARERDELDRQAAKEAARERVESVLLKGLAKELKGNEELLRGWTVKFDLIKVTGDPEGMLRGPPINTRHKSIKFVAPDDKVFNTRQAVVAHFGLDKENTDKDEEDDTVNDQKEESEEENRGNKKKKAEEEGREKEEEKR